MSSRDAVINLRGTNTFSPIAQAAARDAGNLINVFRGFNAQGQQVTKTIQGLGSYTTAFNSQGQALSRTVGGLSPAFRTFGADVTVSNNALRQLTPGLQQVEGAADRAGQGFSRAGQFMAKFRGTIFGATGLLTSGIEAVGMLQNLEMSAERVSEAQSNLNRIVAEGGSGTREHTNALRELANANRAYNFQQRITFLSISDMIPFTLNLTNSLSNMGFGMNTVTTMAGKLRAALHALQIAVMNLSRAQKAALIGTGIGAALVAAGFVLERFMLQADDAAIKTEKAMGGIDAATNTTAANFKGKMLTMEEAIREASKTIKEEAEAIASDLATLQGQPLPQAVPGAPKGGTPTALAPGTTESIPLIPESTLEKLAEAEGKTITFNDALLELFNKTIADGRRTLIEMGTDMFTVAKLTDGAAAKIAPLGQALRDALAKGDFDEVARIIGEINLIIANDLNPSQKENNALTKEEISLRKKLQEEYLKLVDAADEMMRQRSQEAVMITDQENTIAAAFGKRIKMNTMDVEVGNALFEIAKRRLKGWKEEEIAIVDLAEKHGVLNGAMLELAANEEDNVNQLNTLVAASIDYTRAVTDLDTRQRLTAEGFRDGIIAVDDFMMSLEKGIVETKTVNLALTQLAMGFGIDLPAGIQLTNENLMSLITAYRETGTAAGAMAKIHNEVFSEMHGVMDETVNAFIEGGDKWKDTWKEIKDSIPKDERSFFKGFIEDSAELQEANEVLFKTGSSIEKLLDTTRGFLTDEQAENWSDKLVKGIKDVQEEADELPGTATNIDGLAEAAIKLAKSAETGEDFRVLVNFTNDLNEAMKGGLTSDEVDALNTKYAALFNTLSQMTPEERADELWWERMLPEGDISKVVDTIPMPSPVEPEGVDDILDAYKNKIQTLGSSGGGGGGGAESAADEEAGVGSSSIFNPIVVPAPDFITEFQPGFQNGIALAEAFSVGVQEQLSLMWDAGTQIMADFNSTIQEELSALHEAGIEIMADFNSSIQEEISAMHQFGTEVTEDMISTMQESFDSLDTSDAVDAIEELEDAIDNLKSKTVTVTVKVKREGGSGGGSSGGGGAGRQHGGLDFVTKPTDFTMGEHYLPEIVQVVKAGGRSLYDDIGGDVNRLINRSRSGSTIRGEVQAIRSEYMARLQHMITRIVRDITSRAVHVTVMTPNRKVLADEMIYHSLDDIGSYRGR